MSSGASLDKVIDAMSSANGTGLAGPRRKPKKEVTMEDFQKVLDTTPLFMRETPKDGETNDVLEALKSLIFEGEGDEVAFNFKNHGNELYAQKSYRDAITAYTSGLDAGPQDPALRISLLNNRAACNLALKNYGDVLRDTGMIIALSTTPEAGNDEAPDLPPKAPPAKAMYRAAQSLVALERWDEAGDCIARGQAIRGEEANQVWQILMDQVDKGRRRLGESVERERRQKLFKLSLSRAAQSRRLVVLNTSSPPDNPHPFHFDADALPPDPPLYPPPSSEDLSASRWTPPPAHTPLIFPVFLLYPAYNQSDLITDFHEESSFDDHMAVMFPSPAASSSPPWAEWDMSHEYYTSNLAVYVETSQGRLLKVGKELTLREVLAKAVRDATDSEPTDGVVLRDGLLSFVVLAKGRHEKEWIDEFKRKRDQGKR